jgi:hypothetical protein
MGKNLKYYFLYPLYQGNVATIIAPSFLFSFMIFLSQKFASFTGSYGAVPGLLLAIAIVCFSLDYLRQIIKSSARGEVEPPEWNIEKLDVEEMFKGVIPLAVSLFEILFIVIPVIFFISLRTRAGFWDQFISLWKILVVIPFVILYPVNLLSYSIFDDFIIVRIFRILSKTSILRIFIFYTLSFAALVYFVLLPIWKNFFFILISFGVIFYLSQVWAYGLGNVYDNDVNFFVAG